MAVTFKRVVLNPLAYLTPFVVIVVLHHLPMLLAFGLIDKPAVGYHGCRRLERLFDWLTVAFALHMALAALMLLSVLLTLALRVYHKRRPESPVILLVFLLYMFNLGWTIYGEAALRTDTSGCDAVARGNWEQVQDRADEIGYFQHFDFIFSVVVVALGACTSYMCGVHTGDDVAEAEKRWQKRCMCMFRAFTCRSVNENDDEIFESLGRMLGKFFVVRYETNQYAGLSFSDLSFSLGLVSRVQRKERKLEKERAEALAVEGAPTVMHFPANEEQKRLADLAFYGKMAIGIYGWPVYVWYSPCYWFRIFACFKRRAPPDTQLIENDNKLQGNRSSFVNYTGVKDDELVYLNCANSVFQAPYSIVKDPRRRELIICVRGSLSFYDFVTDGLAQIVPMTPDELPDDIPNKFTTRTHDGMLRTARSIFQDLQQGTRRDLFWDFAMANCSIGGPTDDDENDWTIVVCGHSMGAGVGGILSILLRRFFPTTRAFLYAPPMLFDPATAAWSKAFMTTAVYGDDIVPRLSIANVARLRDEMADQFDEVAPQRLFKIKYGKHVGKAKEMETAVENEETDESPSAALAGPRAPYSTAATDLNSTEPPSSGSVVLEFNTNEFPGSGGIINMSAVDPSSSTESGSGNVETRERASGAVASVSFDPAASGMSTRSMNPRQSRSNTNTDMIRLPLEPEEQDVDVPGVIVHIETVHMARRCGCTVFLGEQEMQYTLRDASHFRRILVNQRALQDHMVHHYDRCIAHLVQNCVDFETRAADHGLGATRSSRVSTEWANEVGIDREPLTPMHGGGGASKAPYKEMGDMV